MASRRSKLQGKKQPSLEYRLENYRRKHDGRKGCELVYTERNYGYASESLLGMDEYVSVRVLYCVTHIECHVCSHTVEVNRLQNRPGLRVTDSDKQLLKALSGKEFTECSHPSHFWSFKTRFGKGTCQYCQSFTLEQPTQYTTIGPQGQMIKDEKKLARRRPRKPVRPKFTARDLMAQKRGRPPSFSEVVQFCHH